MEEVDLDKIQVVDVTGRAHRDKQRRSRRSCDCSPSLRASTILIFVCIAIVYVIALVIGDLVLFFSLEDLDKTMCNNSINRLTMLIEDDITALKQLTVMNGHTNMTYNYMTTLLQAIEDHNETLKQETIAAWELEAGIFTLDYTDPTFQTRVFQYSSYINYFALLDINFNTVYSVYYPSDIYNSGLDVGYVPRIPAPVIKPDVYKAVKEESGRKNGDWYAVLIPDENVFEPMMVTFERVKFTDVINPKPGYDDYYVGYYVTGRSILTRIRRILDAVPTCITVQDGLEEDYSKWDSEDIKYFKEAEKTPGHPVNKAFAGTPVFAQRDNSTLAQSKYRLCPEQPLFPFTSTLMTGYIDYCGLDPAKHGTHHCFWMRLDRPMSMVEEGVKPLLIMSAEIIAIVIALFVIFVIFLDFVVLRRIEALSNVIKKQTRGHQKAQEEEDETTAGVSVAEEKNDNHGKSGKSSKSGKSAASSSENSFTTNSSEGGGEAPRVTNARDEIGNLKRAMEQNAIGLRKRLETVNDSIKGEQQKAIHHKQAMQLLNLWCGRKDFFPGLRPNAMQLRYEPTRNLDDILHNPLAIEYLKSHCESDRTLENLWFLLDVSWLEELEAAEDNEENPEKRAQIHDVAESAAKTIMKRYIVENAPQEINVCSATFMKLRAVGEKYTRKMFDEAVSEVKLLLNTDILPRFQKTSAYSAMSETLYIDSAGGGDESSEFSEETGSTAGSVLTDEGDEAEGNVGRVFAHTFKNLHSAFDIAHDENSSSSGASSSRASGAGLTSASLAAGTIETATSGDRAGKETSSASEFSAAAAPGPSKLVVKEPVPKKEEEPKKEEPKKEEPKKEEPKKEEPKKEEPKKEEPKKEEPKKEESSESSDSSDSSSTGSISSDTLTESTSNASD